jgi:hypothetical protein
MAEKIEAFYCQLKDFHDRISRIRSKTVSTREFKKEATEIYETWMTEIQPTLRKFEIKDDAHSRLDELFDTLDFLAKMRVTNVSWVKENLSDTKDRFFKEVILNVRKIESPEPTADLMDSASFLGLDTNWSVAVCGLQLQWLREQRLTSTRQMSKRYSMRISSLRISHLTTNTKPLEKRQNVCSMLTCLS